MSDQTPPPDLRTVEPDLRSAHEQVQQARSILADALAEGRRLAGEVGRQLGGQPGGDRR